MVLSTHFRQKFNTVADSNTEVVSTYKMKFNKFIQTQIVIYRVVHKFLRLLSPSPESSTDCSGVIHSVWVAERPPFLADECRTVGLAPPPGCACRVAGGAARQDEV